MQGNCRIDLKHIVTNLPIKSKFSFLEANIVKDNNTEVWVGCDVMNNIHVSKLMSGSQICEVGVSAVLSNNYTVCIDISGDMWVDGTVPWPDAWYRRAP